MGITRKFFISILFCALFTISKAQIISTIAGDGVGGFSGNGGLATAAEIATQGITVDIIGNVYISDGDSCVRKINTAGIINSFAGNGVQGYSGDGGPATAAELESPAGMATDDSGNVFIADEANDVIRKVNTSGIISTFAGIRYYGSGGGGYSGDGGPATAAEFGGPTDVAIDKSGNVFIADEGNNVIRKVNTSGIISTFAGNGYGAGTRSFGGFTGDGGPATVAEFFYPGGVAVDAQGNVYIADYDNQRIRKVNTSDTINTVAGNGTSGFSGDGGPATDAEIAPPWSVAVDDSGNFYIPDSGNHRIRKVNTSGIINTIAGNGIAGFSGDGGPATVAELYNPLFMAMDTLENIYLADDAEARVRKITEVLSVLANVTSNVICNGGNNGSATALANEGTNPYTYSWSPNGGSNASATGLSAGTYTVIVIDSNNLKGSATITITQPSTLGISASIITNINCNGENNGSASSTVSGGTAPYTYLWSDADSQTAITATGLIAGAFTITITDSDGCTASTMVSISQPAAIIPSIIEYAGIRCNGDSDAAFFAVATGGSGFYAYSWSDASSQATALATGLSAGNYTVTVTDNNGCTGTASETITQPSALGTISDSVNATGGNCNGSAWVIVTGGTPLYTYLWTGGLTTDTITNQCEGYYCSTVTDANGCIDSVCVTINVSTGVNNISNSSNINIYPDPNNGIFTVNLSNIYIKYNIEIYTMMGQQIFSKTLLNMDGDNTINLNTEADGVYFYRVISESGNLIGEGKLIIEK